MSAPTPSPFYYVVTTHPRDRLCRGSSETEVRASLAPHLKPGEAVVAMRPARPEDIAYVTSQGGAIHQ